MVMAMIVVGDGLGDGGEDRDGCGQPPRGRDHARVRGAGAQHNQPGDERPEEDGGAALERLLVDLAEALHLEAVPAEGGADAEGHHRAVAERYAQAAAARRRAMDAWLWSECMFMYVTARASYQPEDELTVEEGG